MLTITKPAQVFLIFSLGLALIGGGTGCAPAGARALLKGERLLKEGKYSEAVKKFEEATKALPDNAKAWNHLGLGYQHAGDARKASQAYQQALTLDRNLAAARYNLGVLHLAHKNHSAAIVELTTFTTLEPNNPDGWLKLGTAQMQFGSLLSGTEKTRNLDAAAKSFAAAQKIRSSAEVLNATGLLQVQRGRPREAIPYFGAALQQQTNYPPALLNLAVVYHQHLNEKRLAVANYRRFLSVTKTSPERAQVEAVTRDLENELNPPPAIAVAAPQTPPPVASKPPVPIAAEAPKAAAPVAAKIETNPPAPATAPTIAPKPAPVIASPKAQPPPRQETPVEVAKLPDEIPIKPAQDVPSPIVNKPVAMTSSIAVTPMNVAPVNTGPATNGISTTRTPEKGSGVLKKMNPVTWFKGKPKGITPMTDLPSPKSPGETVTITAVEPRPVEKVETKATPMQPVPAIPRYKYRSPKKPAEGKRAEAEPFFARGVQAQRGIRLADALEAYRQAIKLDPSYFEANYNLALTAREAGDISAALSAYEQALAIMPESVNARYNFAFTLQEAGYFHDSANELKKLLGQNPNETRAQLLLGNLCAQRLNQVSTARENYLKVLEAEPGHPQATQIRYWLAAHP